MSWGVALRNAVGLGLGGIPSLLNGVPYPRLSFNFLSGTLDPRITFTRASSATYVNSAGVLSTATTDAPRFDYKPVTLAPLGLLIEEQRTNSIRNNTMQGAAAGTPGTIPTNWGSTGSGLGTLTQTVVDIGTQNGINYIDYRFFGTTSTVSYGYSFETPTQIVASPGQVWTGSCYFNVVGGSTTNITSIAIANAGRSSVGATLEFFPGPDIKDTTSLTRYALTSTLVNASTARVSNSFIISFASGVAIDITIRIGLPQLELGAFATSVIPTTTVELTRAADVASVTGANFSSWFNAVYGTMFVEFGPYGDGGASKNFGVAQVDDGTSANMIRFFAGSTVSPVFSVTTGSVIQAYLSSLTIAPTNVSKIAGAYETDGFARSVNGTTATTDSLGTVPAVNRLLLGSGLVGVGELNGYIRSFKYYPTRLSNSKLQLLTR